MTNKEAYRVLGERAEQLANNEKVQAYMVKMIQNGKTKEEAESWLYQLAIASLIGI